MAQRAHEGPHFKSQKRKRNEEKTGRKISKFQPPLKAEADGSIFSQNNSHTSKDKKDKMYFSEFIGSTHLSANEDKLIKKIKNNDEKVKKEVEKDQKMLGYIPLVKCDSKKNCDELLNVKANISKNINDKDKASSTRRVSTDISSSLTLGSIVWAKVDGYPWWPAMIDNDPDIADYVKGNGVFTVSFRKKAHSTQIEAAKNKAKRALTMTVEERLNAFSFIKNYKLEWGDYQSSSTSDEESVSELQDRRKNQASKENKENNLAATSKEKLEKTKKKSQKLNDKTLTKKNSKNKISKKIKDITRHSGKPHHQKKENKTGGKHHSHKSHHKKKSSGHQKSELKKNLQETSNNEKPHPTVNPFLCETYSSDSSDLPLIPFEE